MSVDPPDFSQTLISLLVQRAADDPDAPMVTFTDGAAYSRGEVLGGALRTAGELQAAGIGPGDRVAIMAGNRIEFVWYLFACAHLGAILVPVNTALRGDLLRHILTLTEPALAFAATEFLPQLRAVDVIADGTVPVRELPAQAPASPGPPASPVPPSPAGQSPAAGSDVVAIMFTSGTTGRSKGVGWTHQMALYDAYGSAVVMDYRPGDVIYTCLPLFHITALCTSLLGSLLAGGSVVISPRFSASRFWPEVVACGATVTNMMGSMIAILWRLPPSPLERQHKLRISLVIPAPTGYYDEFEQRFGITITQLYGSTDMSIPIGMPYGARRPGSCGKALDGWEIRIADGNDFPVADGETGELLIRPQRPFVGQLGYWRMPEETVRAWRNLWFHTGDLFRRDSGGWLFYVGRNKDAIRKSGENVSAFEVELAVMAFPDVLEAAVFGVPSELGEEEVAVVVVPHEGGTVDLAEMRAFLEERLPLFAVPRFAAVRVELPKTQTQKIKKEMLRADAVTPDMADLGPTSVSRVSRRG
jgi:crotonobetaine/carnitine-CoA ligase